MAGLEQIDAGDVLIDGCSVAATPPWQRDIAIMFQDFALFPQIGYFSPGKTYEK